MLIHIRSLLILDIMQ